ncbi:unnamed protein product [Orchesella dallaii]|uniref:Protein tipE n=1 Tax=Orchesella dallaii TaxID=48710 RepID=A0ABP1QF16_9HEXA
MGGRKVCAWLLANCEVQLCSALAAVSILGVVVMCPVMLDPAIDTLVSSFDEGMCQTVYNQFLRGLSNCTWTSCREGCTAEVYSCYHIIVLYVKGTADNLETFHKTRANANVSPNSVRLDVEEHEISSDIIESILGGSTNETGTSENQLSKKSGALQTDAQGESPNWILSQYHDLRVYEYNNTFIRDLDANLLSMMNQIRHNIEIESSRSDDEFANDLNATLNMLGIGALLPNPQGCVYPSDTTCAEFMKKYGKVGGPVYPCYISKGNSSTVVTKVDKAAAVRHIFYSFIPLVIASGVFTYLFYRVGLIGSSRRARKHHADEELGSDDEGGSQRNFKERNGGLHNGAPPVVKKKLRKKFLPKNASKKRRKGKIFNKKNLLSIKQLSIKSPSSSRRTPSMSIGAISDDGFSGSNSYSNHRTSVNLL